MNFSYRLIPNRLQQLRLQTPVQHQMPGGQGSRLVQMQGQRIISQTQIQQPGSNNNNQPGTPTTLVQQLQTPGGGKVAAPPPPYPEPPPPYPGVGGPNQVLIRFNVLISINFLLSFFVQIVVIF